MPLALVRKVNSLRVSRSWNRDRPRATSGMFAFAFVLFLWNGSLVYIIKSKKVYLEAVNLFWSGRIFDFYSRYHSNQTTEHVQNDRNCTVNKAMKISHFCGQFFDKNRTLFITKI